LKVEDGLHSAGIAPLSQLAHDLFGYRETVNPLEGSPTESRGPMAIDKAQIVSPDYALCAGPANCFVLPGAPRIGSEPGSGDHEPEGGAGFQQPTVICHSTPPEF
jgi:hypothetical protein